MTRFAQGTEVSAEKSRGEIERTLTRYGADQFMYGWKEDAAVIAFRVHGKQIKFILPMPNRADKRFDRDGRGSLRSPEKRMEIYEQIVRQKWRALNLVIKAKLEAVESGIAIFEDEFLAHIVLPSGETVGAWMRPQIESAYQSGHMPPLLLTGPQN